jgi:hypothetical protein
MAIMLYLFDVDIFLDKRYKVFWKLDLDAVTKFYQTPKKFSSVFVGFGGLNERLFKLHHFDRKLDVTWISTFSKEMLKGIYDGPYEDWCMYTCNSKYTFWYQQVRYCRKDSIMDVVQLLNNVYDAKKYIELYSRYWDKSKVRSLI